MSKKDIRRVLSAINRFRKATGLEKLDEMPKGKRRAATSCPIANGLNHGRKIAVMGRTVEFSNRVLAEAFAESVGGVVVPHGSYRRTHCVMVPSPLAHDFVRFVNEFDRGDLPDYEA